jgi:hypothetical protein
MVEKGQLIETYEAIRISAARSYQGSLGPYGLEKKVVVEKGILAWAIQWGQLRLDAPLKPLSKEVAEQTGRQVNTNLELKNVLTQIALKLVEGGQYGSRIWQ